MNPWSTSAGRARRQRSRLLHEARNQSLALGARPPCGDSRHRCTTRLGKSYPRSWAGPARSRPRRPGTLRAQSRLDHRPGGRRLAELRSTPVRGRPRVTHGRAGLNNPRSKSRNPTGAEVSATRPRCALATPFARPAARPVERHRVVGGSGVAGRLDLDSPRPRILRRAGGRSACRAEVELDRVVVLPLGRGACRSTERSSRSSALPSPGGRAHRQQRRVHEEREPSAGAQQARGLGDPLDGSHQMLAPNPTARSRSSHPVGHGLRVAVQERELDPVLLCSGRRVELGLRLSMPPGRAPRRASQADPYAVPQPSSIASAHPARRGTSRPVTRARPRCPLGSSAAQLRVPPR